jgi:hypothetical protein
MKQAIRNFLASRAATLLFAILAPTSLALKAGWLFSQSAALGLSGDFWLQMAVGLVSFSVLALAFGAAMIGPELVVASHGEYRGAGVFVALLSPVYYVVLAMLSGRPDAAWGAGVLLVLGLGLSFSAVVNDFVSARPKLWQQQRAIGTVVYFAPFFAAGGVAAVYAGSVGGRSPLEIFAAAVLAGLLSLVGTAAVAGVFLWAWRVNAEDAPETETGGLYAAD